MFIDARSLDDNTNIESDICIIGSGPAGITVARKLAAKGKKIAILEGGGLEFNSKTQSLYQGKASGLLHEGYLWMSRMRFFGGSTNLWGGFCTPLSSQDFEKREWIPHSGWPITKQHLNPYYKKAQELLELGPYQYDIDDWLEDNDFSRDFPGDRINASMWQRSRVNFGQKYRKEMDKSTTISVYLNANATNIEPDNSGNHITRVNIKTLNGKNHTAQAKTFILACGGIENARLLLLSNNITKKGLGNNNDLVGRYFMDHPHTIAARVMFTDNRFFKLGSKLTKNKTLIYPNLVTSRETQEKEKLLNSAFTISHEQKDWLAATSVKSAHAIWSSLKKMTATSSRKEPMVTRLFGFMEQAPNPPQPGFS